MKKNIAFLLVVCLILGLAACGKQPESPTQPATEPTAPTVSETAEEYDITDYESFEEIAQLIAQGHTDEETYSVNINGLCTPVTLELEGVTLRAITAFGNRFEMSPEAEDYCDIYGNVLAQLYDYDGMVFLNIWYYDTGYTFIAHAADCYTELYPLDDYSLMIYLNEEGKPVQSQVAMKFAIVHQWETAPIDLAVSREDFYYSLDEIVWEDPYTSTVIAGERYTISDEFDLDAIFEEAKNSGLYPEFDTLDDLLAKNAQKPADSTTEEEERYQDTLMVSREYDDRGNLVKETFHQNIGGPHVTRRYTYDDQNREIAGTWLYYEEEAYRYTKSYDDQDRLVETVYCAGDAELERFRYEYHGDGSYTENFIQEGVKKYAYTFDREGNLTAHSVYRDGEEFKTENLKSLVKAQLVTDGWLPILDNDPVSQHYYYDGTEPVEAPWEGEIIENDDGTWSVINGSVDEEDGEYYEIEKVYDNGQLIQKIFRDEQSEYSRHIHSYDENGRLVRTVEYDGDEEFCTTTTQYNAAGKEIRLCTKYAADGSEHIVEYSYNKKGWLEEAVCYDRGEESWRDVYKYDDAGRLLPEFDSCQFILDDEGMISRVRAAFGDWVAGDAVLRYRTVYVTPENADALRENLNDLLRWF